MSNFSLGLKVLRRLCVEQDAVAWNAAKLSNQLFKPVEQEVFEFVRSHVAKHHALPQIATLEGHFPETKEVEVPEPASYYVEKLENMFYHSTLTQAAIDCSTILKEDQDAHEKAKLALVSAVELITLQQYRQKIMDVSKDLRAMILDAYHHPLDAVSEFGWPYMDVTSGGVVPGDVVSLVGRPAQGKTFQMLYCAMHNWKAKRNVLFVSMEMALLPLGQRIAAMYAHTGMSQLKTAGYANIGASSTYKKFVKGLQALGNEQAKFYVVDGNLAASAEDIFVLADMLECQTVYVDGAYLMRHKNTKLDRFTRAAENVELMKRHCSDNGQSVFASWQFNRNGSQKQKKKGETADLDDIGYSDAIGQISSIVLGLFQEEGVETMVSRKIRVLKGRNGEAGEFEINWDFLGMDFSQKKVEIEKKVLAFI
jgi:replicative DNA helicase